MESYPKKQCQYFKNHEGESDLLVSYSTEDMEKQVKDDLH